MDLIGDSDWEATGRVVRCLAVSMCLPVVLISYSTLALEYTLVRRNSVSLKILLDSNGPPLTRSGTLFGKTPIKKNAL